MKKILSTVCLTVLSAIIYCTPTFSSLRSPITESVHNSSDSAIINQETVNSITLKNAMLEFKSLSRQERKARIKEVKVAMKEYKAQKASGADASTNTLLLVILAILLPPLAVYLHENTINGKFWLDLILTLLFFLPGVIYALIVVLS